MNLFLEILNCLASVATVATLALELAELWRDHKQQQTDDEGR